MLCAAQCADSELPHFYRLVDWINAHDGVEWCTFAEMAEEFKAGRI